MTTFEYKRLGFNAAHRQILEDGRATKAPGDLDARFWERVAELGREGWDLVATYGEVMVFRREAGAYNMPLPAAAPA